MEQDVNPPVLNSIQAVNKVVTTWPVQISVFARTVYIVV